MQDLFNDQKQALTLVDDQAELICYKAWLNEQESSYYLNHFLEQLNWQSETLMIAGKQVESPRLVAWYGDPGTQYRYSGKTYVAQNWHPDLYTLKERIYREFSAPLNSLLANLYRSGKDSMGWHADSEKELGKEPIIFSLSLGASRFFDFRLNNNASTKKRIELEAGTLLIMKGKFQELWQHQIPKQLKINEARINLTFRYIHK